MWVLPVNNKGGTEVPPPVRSDRKIRQAPVPPGTALRPQTMHPPDHRRNRGDGRLGRMTKDETDDRQYQTSERRRTRNRHGWWRPEHPEHQHHRAAAHSPGQGPADAVTDRKGAFALRWLQSSDHQRLTDATVRLEPPDLASAGRRRRGLCDGV